MKLTLQLGKLNFTLGSDRSTRNSELQTRNYPPQLRSWLRGEDIPSHILSSPYEQSIWVYTAVSALAQTVSSVPFRISKGDRSGENIISRSEEHTSELQSPSVIS